MTRAANRPPTRWLGWCVKGKVQTDDDVRTRKLAGGFQTKDGAEVAARMLLKREGVLEVWVSEVTA